LKAKNDKAQARKAKNDKAQARKAKNDKAQARLWLRCWDLGKILAELTYMYGDTPMAHA